MRQALWLSGCLRPEGPELVRKVRVEIFRPGLAAFWAGLAVQCVELRRLVADRRCPANVLSAVTADKALVVGVLRVEQVDLGADVDGHSLFNDGRPVSVLPEDILRCNTTNVIAHAASSAHCMFNDGRVAPLEATLGGSVIVNDFVECYRHPLDVR